MCFEITTERLQLRPFAPIDLPRQVELANNEAVVRMTGSMPYPYTKEDAQEWVNSHGNGRDKGTDFPFAITTEQDGLVGAIGLHKKDTELFDLGYWLGQPYWGQGLASEAARAVMHWGQEQLDMRAATACYFADNPASARVLEKVGFLRTGSNANCHSKARNTKAFSIGMIWIG